jgi:AcrR family transcriptional regulator
LERTVQKGGVMKKRKEQLLAAATDYFLEHGIAGVSLRPLGSAIGSSARLLIFHFKSKEALITEALAELERRLQTSFQSMAQSHRPERGVSLYEELWLWATQPKNLRCLRLAYEVQVLANRDGALSQHLQSMTSSWMKMVLESLPQEQRDPSTRTLYTAFFDGLVLDLLSTGERRRTTGALRRFVALAGEGKQSLPDARGSDAHAPHGPRGARVRSAPLH